MKQGFAWPFRFAHTGGITLRSGIEHKRELISSALLTGRGARVRRPDVGTVGTQTLFRGTSPLRSHTQAFLVLEELTRSIPDTLFGDILFREKDTTEGHVVIGDVAFLDEESEQAAWASAALGGQNGNG